MKERMNERKNERNKKEKGVESTQTVASKKRASLKRALPIGKGRMRPITHQSKLSKQ